MRGRDGWQGTPTREGVHVNDVLLNLPCRYHSGILVTTTTGEPPSCGCGALTAAAATRELIELRAMRYRAVESSMDHSPYSDQGTVAKYILDGPTR